MIELKEQHEWPWENILDVNCLTQDSACGMISFKWKSPIGKIKYFNKNQNSGFLGKVVQGLRNNMHNRTFWGNGKALHLSILGTWVTWEYVLSSLNCIFLICKFHSIQILKNNIYI